MKKTKAWTTHTISSNIPKTLPSNHIPEDILQIKESKICPALILASNRKDKVTGRTNKLTNSTIDKKGIKYQGELEGKIAAIVLGFKNKKIKLEFHKQTATLKLKERVVVTG